MSQHSQRIQQGPTAASVATGLVMVMVSATVVAYVLTAPDLGVRDIMGAALGAGLIVLLGLRTLELAVERRVIQYRQERALEREQAAQREDRAREERIREWQESEEREEEALEEQRFRDDLRAAYDVPGEPDQVATQPEDVEHWADGGEPPQEEMQRSGTDCPECSSGWACPDHMPGLPVPYEQTRPGVAPASDWYADRSDWYDRSRTDWPTEVMARQT